MRNRRSIALILVMIVIIAALFIPALKKPVPPSEPTPEPDATREMEAQEQLASTPSSDGSHPAEFISPPVSFTSRLGVTFELSEAAFGADCLRISTSLYGDSSLLGPMLLDGRQPPFTMDIINPASGSSLELELIGGGGGGGGPSSSSNLRLQEESIYSFVPRPSPQGVILLTIQVAARPELGFAEPIMIGVAARPYPQANCGLQGGL